MELHFPIKPGQPQINKNQGKELVCQNGTANFVPKIPTEVDHLQRPSRGGFETDMSFHFRPEFPEFLAQQKPKLIFISKVNVYGYFLSTHSLFSQLFFYFFIVKQCFQYGALKIYIFGFSLTNDSKQEIKKSFLAVLKLSCF